MSAPDGHEPPPLPLQSSMLEQILEVKYIGLASKLLHVASRLSVGGGGDGEGGGGDGEGGGGEGGGGICGW